MLTSCIYQANLAAKSHHCNLFSAQFNFALCFLSANPNRLALRVQYYNAVLVSRLASPRKWVKASKRGRGVGYQRVGEKWKATRCWRKVEQGVRPIIVVDTSLRVAQWDSLVGGRAMAIHTPVCHWRKIGRCGWLPDLPTLANNSFCY